MFGQQNDSLIHIRYHTKQDYIWIEELYCDRSNQTIWHIHLNRNWGGVACHFQLDIRRPNQIGYDPAHEAPLEVQTGELMWWQYWKQNIPPLRIACRSE
jgi:hypothetical protein